MIESITVKNPKATAVGWFEKVFPEGLTMKFAPGLNVLWGANGSGKSTILRLIAKMLHCEQGYEPVVTSESMRSLTPRYADRSSSSKEATRKEKFDAVQLVHSGLGTCLFDPDHKVGLIGGAFDDDFFSQGLMNTMFRGSSGQGTMHRFDRVLVRAMAGKAPEVVWKVRKEDATKPLKAGASDYDIERHEQAKWVLDTLAGDPTIANAERPTFMMDEPDRSLDILRQKSIWHMLRCASQRSQIIVAAHSLFALGLPEATYHKLGAPGAPADLYYDRSLAQVAELLTWPSMKIEMSAGQKKAIEAAVKDQEKNKDPFG